MKQLNVLLIGSGGREHAIATFLATSPHLGSLIISPGNPGTKQLGENVPSQGNQPEQWIPFIRERSIDLIVIGPEQPLVQGWADSFREQGIAVFGPSKEAAQLEGSKSYSKAFMQRHAIPTASYRVFQMPAIEDGAGDQSDPEEWNVKGAVADSDPLAWIRQNGQFPIVLKADGLAGGKGVFICHTMVEAIDTLHQFQNNTSLSGAASQIVVEEFMEGEELSVFVISDGKTWQTLQHAQDHKKIGEGDTGLNTGGMGAYAPAPFASETLLQTIETRIVQPTLEGMRVEGHPYSGILYVGLMLTNQGPKVVEYNCRFGDPECQVILPTLKNDLLELMWAVSQQQLSQHEIQVNNKTYTCVVLASKGYPESYDTGFEIHGLDLPSTEEDTYLFHAGTKEESGRILTNGGRVLNVVGSGQNLQESIRNPYKIVDQIHFENEYHRTDIGKKGLFSGKP